MVSYAPRNRDCQRKQTPFIEPYSERYKTCIEKKNEALGSDGGYVF